MMFTAPMTQLFALVLEKDSKAVTEAILCEGVMQFISVSEYEPKVSQSLSDAGPEATLVEISDMRKRVEGFLHTVGIIPCMPKETDLNRSVTVDIEKEKKHLNKIDAERERIREKQRLLQQEALKLEDIRRQVQIYGLSLSGADFSSARSLITMQTGKLPVANVKQVDDLLKGLPALSISLGREDDTAYQLLISMKRDNEQISKSLSNIGWAKVEFSSELMSDKKNLFDEITVRLKKITDEQKEFQAKVNELVKLEEKKLTELWVNLRINELCYRIQANFKSSLRTILFAGWLPSSKKEALTRRITNATQNRCYMEWYDAGSSEMIGDEVPVVFNNPKILAPFQLLVSNFGIPKYGTIDPTPFVMPIYLAMFGLMFPDVGQGMVLVILGIIGAFFLRKKEERKNYYQISWLVIWCGLFSVLFGALFGSYFGLNLFKPLWFNFHSIVLGHNSNSKIVSSLYDILSITLYFGITVIFIGLVFNWINLVRTKEYMDLILDKGGILGGWIYGGGIYIVFYLMSNDYKRLPGDMTTFLLLWLPSLLLFVKGPYHHFKNKGELSEKKSNPIFLTLSFLMEWIVELLEIFSGYLSNTLSFMRVAGLGIAHACLMIAFFTLADMTSGVFAWLILILGNIIVISLEGLSAGVQALRLNYYEFFTKFFHVTGKLHTPISLNSKL